MYMYFINLVLALRCSLERGKFKMPSTRKKKRQGVPRKTFNQEQRLGLLFLGPTVFLILLVMVYPLAETLRLSFFRSTIGLDDLFVGFSNYWEQLRTPRFWYVLRNTAIWTVGSILFQMLLGIWAAMMVSRRFRGALLFRILLLLPWTVPSIVRAETWKWLYNPLFGPLNGLLMDLRIIETPVAWLADPRYSIYAVIVENVWGMFPFVMLMVLAGLQSIPKDLYEAAAVDGATGWKVTWYITLPQLRGVLFAVGLLLTIWTMNAFTGLFVMTKGGPVYSSTTASLYIYKLAMENWDFGMASAVAVILFIVTLSVSAAYLRVFDQGE
jgi:multiple sugar transport system permease protein